MTPSQTRHRTRTPDQRNTIANTALNEGIVLIDQETVGSLRAAISKLKVARSLFRETRNRSGEAHALIKLGSVNYLLGEYQQALLYLNQALPLTVGVEDQALRAGALNNIGLVYNWLGEYQEALSYYNQALLVARTVEDKREAAAALNNIGLVHRSLEEYEQALVYHNQALLLIRVAEDKRAEVTALINIALVHELLGEYKKALSHYNQALSISRTDKYQRGLAYTLSGMGVVYDSLGDRRMALDYYELALILCRVIGDRKLEAETLNNIGVAYDLLGEYHKALHYHRLALPLFRAIRNKDGEAVSLNRIGSVYSVLGDYETALRYLEQALALFKGSSNRHGQAVVVNDIGLIYNKLGENQKAIDYLNQALSLAKGVKDRADEAAALSNMMVFWQNQNNAPLAIFYGKQAINIYQQLRVSIRDLEQQIQKTYLRTIAKNYRFLANSLIEQGRLPEAQFVLGLLKDQEFFEFVRRDKDEIAALARSVEFNESERRAFGEYAALADQLTAIGAKYQRLFDKRSKLGGNPLPDLNEENEFQKLSQQLMTTSNTFQKFLNHLGGEFAKAKPAARIQIERLNELQSDLRELGSDVVLVSTFVFPDRYRVIVTTGQTQVDRMTEIKETDLNNKVNCFLMALKTPGADPRPLGKELYDILIKPLEVDLENGKIKTILWSLDGALRYIPVAALWDGEHYLAERYQNVNIMLGRNSRLFREVNRDWRALGAGVSSKWPGFDELPSVKDELSAVVRDERAATETEGALPGRRLLDSEFVAGRLRDLLPSQEQGRPFNIVHIASHFNLGQTWDTSSLLLGDGTELSLTEFDKDPRLKLTKVELLTLSACETGVGIAKGDGSEFESFGMLAEKNGAKAVMATLWKVADCSTVVFMREFYRLYQEGTQGMTKAAALQRAQETMLSGTVRVPLACQARTRDATIQPNVCSNVPPFSRSSAKPFAHPYYWAPFVLLGNWR